MPAKILVAKGTVRFSVATKLAAPDYDQLDEPAAAIAPLIVLV